VVYGNAKRLQCLHCARHNDVTFCIQVSKFLNFLTANRSIRLVEKSTRLDRLDRLVDDFSIDSTWQIFDRLDRIDSINQLRGLMPMDWC